MFISVLLTIALLAFLAGGIVWSIFKRRMRKTRVRCIGIGVSLVLTIILTIVLRSTVFSADTLLPWIEAKLDPSAMELFGEAPALGEAVLGAVAGLITPLLFFVIFLILNFISWIVYLLINLIRGASMKELDEDTPYNHVPTIIMAVAQTLVVAIVWMIPFAAYTSIATAAMESVSQSGMLEGEEQEGFDVALNDYVKPLNENIVLGVFRVFGGTAITNVMTDFQVDGQTAHLKDEVEALTGLICDFTTLSEVDMEEYGSKQAAALNHLAKSFQKSTILPLVGGGLIHDATAAWMENEDFGGMGREEIYIDKSGTLDGFTDLMIEILYEDSVKGKQQQLCDDITTITNVMGIMINNGAFKSLGDSDGMVHALSDEGVISEIVKNLGSNPSTKVLIPEITNIGVSSIADTLGIRDNTGEVYDNMIASLTEGLNRARYQTEDAQLIAVSEVVWESFDDAGMPVSEDMVDGYAAAMIESLISDNKSRTVTENDVKAFFAVYAWSASSTKVIAVQGNDPTVPLSASDANWRDALSGTVFAGMSDERLAKTGPAILARFNVKLYQASTATNAEQAQTYRDQAANIIETEYASRLNLAAQTMFREAAQTLEVDLSSIRAAASMQSHDLMKNHTRLITLQDLTLDVYASADHITAGNIEHEAAAVELVFVAAQRFLKDTEGASELKLNTIASSVGTILNELGSTAFFGEEKAADLFTAILQSEMVRDKADLDIVTATKMAEAGADDEKGDVDYVKVFLTISRTVSMMETMNKDRDDLSDDDIDTLLRDIDPQSAGMMEIYITPERMEESYEVPERHAGTAAPLVSNMFNYMAEPEEAMTDEQYKKEATATNNVLTLTMAARDNANDGNPDSSLFGEDGVFGKSAADTLDELMASKSLAHSLRETEYDHDPFEVSTMMQRDEERDEKVEMEDAIRDYYKDNNDAESYETLGNIADLFGLDPIDTILGK